MEHIQNHLAHMLCGNQTTTANASRALLDELRTVNHDSRTLELLGRHVLTIVSADLRSGLHAQKVMQAAMKGPRND